MLEDHLTYLPDSVDPVVRAKIQVLSNDGVECWIWMGARMNGQPCHGKKYVRRVVYQAVKAVDLTGKALRRRCNTETCVNPNHCSPGRNPFETEYARREAKRLKREGTLSLVGKVGAP